MTFPSFFEVLWDPLKNDVQEQNSSVACYRYHVKKYKAVWLSYTSFKLSLQRINKIKNTEKWFLPRLISQTFLIVMK